jgi:hypothetical protein
MDVALPRRPRAKRSSEAATTPLPAPKRAAPEPADWAKWKAQLARRGPLRLPGLDAATANLGGGSAVLWGSADCLDADGRSRIVDLHRALQKGKLNPAARSLTPWVNQALASPTVQTALEAVAWAYALPALSQVVDGEAWCAALDALHAFASPENLSCEQQPLVCQLRAVELAGTLAKLFPELGSAKPLVETARQLSAKLLQTVLDEEGLLPSDRLSLVRPLWASWVRTRLLETMGCPPLFDDAGKARLDKFFRHGLRLTRANGSAVFGPTSGGEPALIAATEQAAVSSTTRKVVQAAQWAVVAQVEKGLPHPPWYSESRGLAVLRNRWSPLVDQATVRFVAAEVDAEWQAGGRVLGSGPWSWQASVNGNNLQADGNWEEVCWHSDADVDYLELELPLTGGWALQRQVLLARLDRFLYLSDVLIGNDAGLTEPADLKFVSSWPLAEGIRFETARETREGSFSAGGKRLAAAIPLAAPEWRAEFSPSDLKATDDGELQLSVTGRGRNLYCPLWIDLDSRRIQQPCTWRRLSVGQQLETATRDVAVGYRVQSGAQNWLAYRSLGERTSRTVLGQNYSTEFVVCRFQRDGQTVDLLEIQ